MPDSLTDSNLFRHIAEDYRAHGRNFGSQGLWALSIYRYGRWRYTIKNGLLRKPFSLLYHILYKLVQILTGIELPCEAKIGRGFIIDHFGSIIVSGYAEIGDHCRIRNGVVIGLSRIEDPCAPRIGHHVDIGTGAKILGNITIGDCVLIGANAVVVSDIPSNSVAVGIPARVKPRIYTTGKHRAP